MSRARRSATSWPRSRSSDTSSHPHTSAGRIPTDAGYRKYVDSLPPGGRMRDAQRRAIAGFFAETMLDLEEVLKGTTQLLSRVTQYAGLAVPPAGSNEVILRTELLEVGNAVMLLVIGQRGRVDKVLLDRPDGLDAARSRRSTARSRTGCAGARSPRRRPKR